MQRRIALLVAMAVLRGAGRVWAQLYSPETIEQDFRVEWQVGHNRKGPTGDGDVDNKAMRAAEHMRLKIDQLDAAGKVVGSTTAGGLGTVPMGGPAHFPPAGPPPPSHPGQPYPSA